MTEQIAVNFDDESHKSGIITFEKETHTMGNALRQAILNVRENGESKVNFCGYTVPHPAEERMVIRIQLNNDCEKDLIDVACDGLNNFSEWCVGTIAAFDAAVASFSG